jgi:AcrR family transcriptional regulator
MPRPQRVNDHDLIDRLTHVFRAVGYEGASLAQLAAAAGMQKPSLYHRFPGGKRQMAEEVLAAARQWYLEHVFGPLGSEGPPAKRIALVAAALDQFYKSGRQACLLNLLAQPPGEDDGLFADPIREMFAALIDAFAAVAREVGADNDLAQQRALRVVSLLHGSLVLARGMASSAPFEAFTATLADELGVTS